MSEIRLLPCVQEPHLIRAAAAFLDCILRPDIGRTSIATSINHIIQAGRTVKSELDTEIRSGHGESSRLETSREYLQQLLDGQKLTEL